MNYNFIILFCENPNFFKYSFVTILSFCLVFINATVVQIVFFKRKCKSKS